MEIETYIERYDPCSCSIPFLRKFETFEDAWKECPRGDWMLSAAKLLMDLIKTEVKDEQKRGTNVSQLRREHNVTQALPDQCSY